MVSSQLIQQVLLEAIAEADLSRRDFLKRTGAGIVATLLSGGVPPAIVAKAVAGKPVAAFINLNVGWDMGRGEWSDLADSARNLGQIFAFLKRSNIQVKSGAEYDDYFYHVKLTPETLQQLAGTVEWGDDDVHQLRLPASFGGESYEISITDTDPQEGGWMDITTVEHPIVDFWNKFAKFDGHNAVNNAGFVRRLAQTFGDNIDPPMVITTGGDQLQLTWEQFDELVTDPDSYFEHGEYRDPDLDDEDEYDEDEYDEDEYEEEPVRSPTQDEYDEYLRSQWATEGGFSESIQTLYKRIRTNSITLQEALDWVNDLHWPKEAQQRLAISYIERMLAG